MISNLIPPNDNKKIKLRQTYFYFDEGILTSYNYQLEDLCKLYNISIDYVNKTNVFLIDKIKENPYPKEINNFEDLVFFRNNESINVVSDQMNSVTNFLNQSTSVFLWILTEQTENKLINLIEKKINNVDVNGFTDWKRRKQYFKKYNIVIDSFTNYFYVLELQKYNNKVKHLGKVDEELNEFKTFKGKMNYPFEYINIPIENYLNNVYLYIIDLFCEIESKIFKNKLREEYL